MEGLCPWFIYEKGPLRDYLEERGRTYKFFCHGNEQTIMVPYLQCIKFKDIDEREVWNPGRLSRIRKWATPDKLRRVFINENEYGQKVIDKHHKGSLPAVSREGRYPEIKEKKFVITDGVHRIACAKELDMDCILVDVEEAITINRYEDQHLYEGRDNY